MLKFEIRFDWVTHIFVLRKPMGSLILYVRIK